MSVIFFVHDVKENLVLLDHAQLTARSLFNGLVSLFEVAHFRIQRGITHLQFLVELMLPRHLLIDFPYFKPAPLPQPQRILQQGNQSNEDKRQYFQRKISACAIAARPNPAYFNW
jgi:hypothetical protein